MIGTRAAPLSVADLARLYRVLDWVHFLPLPLAGWCAGDTRSVRSLVGGLAAWTMALAFMSAVNQAFDDRLDQRAGKNPVGLRFGRREALLLSVPPALLSVALSAWLSPAGLVPTLLLLVAATVYSAPPRLKRVPVLGTLWNVVIALPGLFLADTPRSPSAPLRLLVALFALLLVVSQLLHEAEDRDDDLAGEVFTVAVVTGVRGALLAASIGLAALPVVTWWLARGVAGRWALAGATAAFAAWWLATIVALVRRGERRGLRAVRLRYRYAALALGAVVFVGVIR